MSSSVLELSQGQEQHFVNVCGRTQPQRNLHKPLTPAWRLLVCGWSMWLECCREVTAPFQRRVLIGTFKHNRVK